MTNHPASTGDTRYRHRMRCGVEACRKRFTLPRPLSEYANPPACPACGDTLRVRDVEQERRREMAKRIKCSCPSYPFIHERGTLRQCEGHVDYGKPLTEEEQRDYEHQLNVRRG